MEMTGTGVIGRGTPVDRARKAMWGWGVVPGDAQLRGRGMERGRAHPARRRTVLGDVTLGMGLPMMPAPQSQPQPQEADQVVWDAFFDSLKREDVDVNMERPASPSPHMDMMGMNMMSLPPVNMNMNVNMNINMSMNMGPLCTSPAPPPTPPPPVSPVDFEMFNVGFGVGVGVGIGMAVGANASAGWTTPPHSPTSPVASEFGMDMGMGMMGPGPTDAFEVPSSSTLSFALG
ncbi:hypothetical protein H0H92_007764 [Tricholoma furcatifolium]|nr:hypothetical protein H0H92_007764 [Tricholoma furcatifolium]